MAYLYRITNSKINHYNNSIKNMIKKIWNNLNNIDGSSPTWIVFCVQWFIIEFKCNINYSDIILIEDVHYMTPTSALIPTCPIFINISTNYLFCKFIVLRLVK